MRIERIRSVTAALLCISSGMAARAGGGKIVWARASEPRMNLRGSIGVTFTEVADALKEKLT
jgi:hypothetical protein